MLGNSQTQSAGNNSQLVQAGTININNGIDEKRAREICDEKINETIQVYSQEARDTAMERMEFFKNDLIPKLVKENLMASLRDPSIQILLIDAQKAAASTERPADYALLSELLIHRIKKGEDRNVRSGISHAVKIVDEISDEALFGLTLAYSIFNFVPVNGNIKEGLQFFNNFFYNLIYSKLPEGYQWIDQLDVLSAVRIDPTITFKKVKDYYAQQLSGYIEVGINKSSENYQQALEILSNAKVPEDVLCDHELRKGFVRLKMRNMEVWNSATISINLPLKTQERDISIEVKKPLSEDQKQALKDVYALYDTNEEYKKENIEEFIKLWDTFENLKTIRIWWESIQNSFYITSVGKVLAHANAQRCYPDLPVLNEI